jgi:hypothetical protein
MAWIKRNIFFVIAIVAGLGATAYCGLLLLSARRQNAEMSEQYATARKSLDDLQNKKPYPDKKNIEAAEEDAERVRTFLEEFQKPFSGFPTPPKVDDRQFKDYLQKTVLMFGTEATNAGVGLIPGYAFSFSQQLDKLNYPAECIAPWTQELEEIKAILRVLYKAKINFLEKIDRPAVSTDESGEDILQLNSVSNQWGVVTPYRIEFRAFSAELAGVLAGMAASSNCFIVKAPFVTPSKVPLPQVMDIQPAQSQTFQIMPQYVPESMGEGSGGRRGGGRRGGVESRMERRPMQAQQAPVAAPSAPTGPVTILRETPLFVTLYIDVVKLKATEAAKHKAPQESKGGARPRKGGRR